MWQILCSALDVSEFIFPSPWRIWTQFLEFKGIIAAHAWRTYWVTMTGFGIAIVVGVLLGFVIGSSRLAYAAVYPLMTGFNALPKAAFVPILVVWFGIGVGPAILTAFLISFFPIMVNIATGLATLEPELEDVLRVLGARRWDVVLDRGQRILLPAEKPVVALERLLAMDQAEKILDRDVSNIDLRDERRPVLRLAPFALSEVRRASGIKEPAENSL